MRTHACTHKQTNTYTKKNSLQKPNKREHFNTPYTTSTYLKKPIKKHTHSQTLYPMTKTPIRVMNTKQELELMENIQQKNPKQNNQAYSCPLTRYPLRSLHTHSRIFFSRGGGGGWGAKNNNKYLWGAYVQLLIHSYMYI